MNKNALHRHYLRLTPEERFRLDVLAMSRGDSQESERLTKTCPKRDYIMNDWVSCAIGRPHASWRCSPTWTSESARAKSR